MEESARGRNPKKRPRCIHIPFACRFVRVGGILRTTRGCVTKDFLKGHRGRYSMPEATFHHFEAPLNAKLCAHATTTHLLSDMNITKESRRSSASCFSLESIRGIHYYSGQAKRTDGLLNVFGILLQRLSVGS